MAVKAVVCKAFGLPDMLVIGELPEPTPGEGQVQIQVKAAGVNFADTLMIAGKYQVKPPFPFAPGLECAGLVSAVGPKVQRLMVGDRVMAICGWGGMAELAVVDETAVIAIPESMEMTVAAGFPVIYGTVYHGLVDRGRLQSGETLLVHGAGGGVGLCAVEVGKLLGARVIATAGGDAKLQLAKSYGADHLIDYSREDIRERVKALTNGRGADVIFDPVGGDAFDHSLKAIAWDGRLLVVGFASGRIPAAPANLVLIKGCSVIGVIWGAFATRDPVRNRENFSILLRWHADRRLRPHISATYPMEHAADAFNALLQRKIAGKAVIAIGQH
jgi:NADPH2:quinone reductase